MGLNTPAWKKQTSYDPVTGDDTSEEHYEMEKARMYGDVKSPFLNKKYLAFLLLPTTISIGTLIALFFMATRFQGVVPAASTKTSPIVPVIPGHDSVAVSHPEPHPPHGAHVGKGCGHTWQEAEARGCIFETISFSWVQPECYFPELVEEFDAKIHTPFFWDSEGKSQMDMEEVRKGHNLAYVPWAHHLWHCAFLWRKMHKSIMVGVPVDSYIGNYTHTEHCGRIMAGEVHLMSEVNTIMALKFPYCGHDELQWTAGTNYTGEL